MIKLSRKVYLKAVIRDCFFNLYSAKNIAMLL